MRQTLEIIDGDFPKRKVPAVLTVAGSDSSGGAGIEADIKSFSAHAVYGLTCITALTAQNTKGVRLVVETSEKHLREIFRANMDDFLYGYPANDHPLKVVKTGMLTEAAAIVLSEWIDELIRKNCLLVVDPVMVSTSGFTLTNSKTVSLCFNKIFPNAYLCTPNFTEAKHLYESQTGESLEDIGKTDQMEKLAILLTNLLGCRNILIKGGHLHWDKHHIFDCLYEKGNDSVTFFRSSYIDSENSHGTGCTLASSISANLANGSDLVRAVAISIDYVRKGMTSFSGKIGHGHGPLDHTVQPATSMQAVVEQERPKNLKELLDGKDHVLDYMKEHVRVTCNWNAYTQHRFVKLLATNQLPFDRFLFFLKQDFYYLVVYARVHGVAASLAPNYWQISAEIKTVDNIMKELDLHKSKLLSQYSIDYDKADLDGELQPAQPCLDYCDYLTKISRTEDYVGLKVAVAACLHGYAEAGQFGKTLRKNLQSTSTLPISQSNAYDSWINDYCSDWYIEAHQSGIQALDDAFKEANVSKQRLEELTDIFNTVVKLEVAFWDIVINE